MELSVILTAVVCGCCGLLCAAVVYLCVLVRKIRRELNELSRNQNVVYTDPNENREVSKDESKRSSAAMRYTIEPCAGKLQNRPGSLSHLAPEESVTFLELSRLDNETPNPGTMSTFQEPDSSQVETHLQFTNVAFEPDGSRDHSSSKSSYGERRDTPPINSNEIYENEQPIYENNEPIDEPLYQNRGELATFNNPERPRLQTMDIMDVP